jgi:hypothetical protein
MRRRTTAAVTLLLAILVFTPSGISDPADTRRASLKEILNELDVLEARDGSRAAAAEIELARSWIAEAGDLRRKGRLRAAAVLRERLPSQLELVRVLVSAGETIEKVEGVERENLALEADIRKLRARKARLVARVDGAAASGAYPPLETDR